MKGASGEGLLTRRFPPVPRRFMLFDRGDLVCACLVLLFCTVFELDSCLFGDGFGVESLSIPVSLSIFLSGGVVGCAVVFWVLGGCVVVCCDVAVSVSSSMVITWSAWLLRAKALVL